MDESHLSLEERRRLNIARHQSFLQSLLGGGGDEDAERTEVSAESDNELHDEPIQWTHIAAALEAFKHRENEIKAFYSYLERVCRKTHAHPLPLAINGSAGVGKSSLVQFVLSSEDVRSVVVKCSQFDCIKHLLRALHVELCELLEGLLESRLQKRSGIRKELQQWQVLHIVTVNDFQQFLDSVRSALAARSVPSARIVLVLDNVDAIESYTDPAPFNTVVSLAQNELLTVVFVCESSTLFRTRGNEISQPLSLHFSPYNAAQKQDILVRMFQRRVRRVLKDNDSQTSTAAVERLVSERVALLCEHALPVFSLSRHHLHHLESLLSSLWRVLFDESVQQSIERCASLVPAPEKFSEYEKLTVRNDQESSSFAVSRASNSVSCENDSLSMPKISAIKAAADALSKMNALHVNSQQVASIQSSINLGTLSTPSKLQRSRPLPITELAISHPQQIPLRLRCLVVAAYIAAHNAKENDNLTFVGDRSKKRKHQAKAESTGSNTKESFSNGAAGNSSTQSQAAKPPAVHRYFPLERLLSIYVQVLKMSGQQMGEGYMLRPLCGSAVFQSLLGSLIQCRLLLRAPQWRPNKPLYGCAAPRSLADVLAASMRFPLGDFLSVHHKHNF